MAFTKVTDNLLSSGVGTGAGNILELDSSGKLPAVDGSNLTGIVHGVDGIVSTANATAITIDSSENVGIGTTSPVSNANYTALTISETGGSGGGQLYLKSDVVTAVFGCDSVSSNEKAILQTNTAHPLIFGTNNTERMRIDSAGNVGIGIVSPTTELHIYSTLVTELLVETSTADQAFTHYKTSATSWSVGQQGGDSGKFKISNATSLGSSEAIEIDTSGRVTKPLQPAFHVTNQGYTQMNATGNGTVHTINYKTINYDVGSNFNTSTYTFTAPVDGKYLFTMSQGVNAISSSAIIVQYYIKTSNVNTVPYMWYHTSGGHPIETRESGSMTCHMDANDTAYTTVMINGMGSDTADPTSSTNDCVFTGQLLS